ncbi:MAG: 3-phenylpropionate/trans-cinnamate dioxygenase ferredoxin reductase component [Cryptosporangiaceae bacterium]|nr:3-phenylpropionate/trans-cinnamate dioxygenase ferredoxin reductase component [Cryptosporangiaceae bacterium]
MGRTIAVVGASLAGWSACVALRSGGFDGRLVLIGDEPHRPYDRPPLSKSFLAGAIGADVLPLATREQFAEVGPDWRLGRRATSLDATTVTLDDGERIEADVVVIATGTRPRTLPGQPQATGLHTLRTLDDALALKPELAEGKRLVVVGGGFIGAEVAATGRELGCEVAVVEAQPLPLADLFGERMAETVSGLHEAHGSSLYLGVAVHEVLVSGGRVRGVRLADGRELPADVVVVGIGVTPNTEWLRGSKVALDGGVLVDAYGATSVPGVYAAGDVVRFPSGRAGAHVRIEHWTHARDHGAAVARAILGVGEPYDPLPYVWSEQYGTMLQFAGYPAADATVALVEGDLAERRFVAEYLRDGRRVAVLGMRSPRTFTRIRKELSRA